MLIEDIRMSFILSYIIHHIFSRWHTESYLLRTTSCAYYLSSCCWPSLERVFAIFASFLQVFIYTGKNSSEPSFLSDKPSWLFITGEVLLSVDHLHIPLLYCLHLLHVSLILRSPKLDTVLQVWLHQC